MNKWLFLFLAMAVVVPSCFGEVLFEREFGEMGHEAFLIEGARKTSCKEIEFLFPEGIDIGDDGIYPIASVGLEIGPAEKGRFDVNVAVNDSNIGTLTEKDFKCTGGKCWERIGLEKGVLLAEENKLKVCVGTGNTVTSISLEPDSKIGLYKVADFSGEESFSMRPEKTNLLTGEKTRIGLFLHNRGSASSLVEIKFARPLAEDKNAFSVVEGKTYYTGVLGPGEEVEISYVVKPRISAYFAIPPAIAYYENVFGETESKFSNLVFLSVREPDRKIEAFIVKEKEEAFLGESIGMKIAVKNVGNDPLYDLAVEIDSEVASKGTMVLDVLNPKETKYVEFSGSSFEAGSFPVGCIIKYNDINAEESSCIESFVEFRERGLGPEVWAGLVLVIVAIGIYIYITRF